MKTITKYMLEGAILLALSAAFGCLLTWGVFL